MQTHLTATQRHAMKLRLLPTLILSFAALAGSGKGACNGPCATLWPPAMAEAAAKAEGDFTIVTRDDGAKQWAFKGKPLYHYSVDKKAGDMMGDKFRDVWHVVK
jgi:predicted lipoprotein with Yx(FWY)xxD motif